VKGGLLALSLVVGQNLVFAFASATPNESQPTITPKNPVSLCERFIAPATKANCEKRIEKLGPDWYLASVCEKLFEDPLFFECLELSKTKNFSPMGLEPCDAIGLSDSERMKCLTQASHVIDKEPQSPFQKAHVAAPHKKSKKRAPERSVSAPTTSAPLDIGQDPN